MVCRHTSAVAIRLQDLQVSNDEQNRSRSCALRRTRKLFYKSFQVAGAVDIVQCTARSKQKCSAGSVFQLKIRTEQKSVE